MSIEELIAQIPVSTSDRYILCSDDEVIRKISSFRPDTIERAHVMRLKRNTLEAKAWRTILVVEAAAMPTVVAAIKWAAGVRDELLNSESADLYLFMITENINDFSIEMCINIEAGDQYCRKYISRPNESVTDLMNRTFLCKFDSSEQLQGVTDPLKLALEKTSEGISQFDEIQQELWRQAFLSGNTGLDLADILFSEELKED